MKLAHFQLLQSIGVPQDILGNLAVPPLYPEVLPVPAPSSSTLRPIPASAVAVPSQEPARSTSLSLLAPAFSLRLFLALRDANKNGLNVALFDGLRTPQRQEWLYQQGRSRPGSRVTNARLIHTSYHGYGLAGDIVFINSKGQWNWPAVENPLWKRWYEVARKWGLTTGLYWKNPVDAPHTYPSYLPASPSAEDKRLLSTAGLAAVWKARDQLTVSESLFKLIG